MPLRCRQVRSESWPRALCQAQEEHRVLKTCCSPWGGHGVYRGNLGRQPVITAVNCGALMAGVGEGGEEGAHGRLAGSVRSSLRRTGWALNTAGFRWASLHSACSVTHPCAALRAGDHGHETRGPAPWGWRHGNRRAPSRVSMASLPAWGQSQPVPS